MISELKKYVSDTFIRNHQLVPIAPLDIRNGINDPRMYNYSGKGSVLFNARTEYGRCFQFLRLDAESNPVVRGLKQLADFEEREERDVIRQSLESYYTACQPESALEWLELTNKEAPELENIPAWAAPTPWSSKSIKSVRSAALRWHNVDHVRMDRDLDITHGHTHFGPVSPEKIEIETERFLYTHKSISQHGYNREDTLDGDIGAFILVSQDGEWRWSAGPGHHRAIVLSALDYDMIPVRVKKIIYESEAAIWPNVHSGLYSEKTALKIFKLFYEGRAF